MPWLQIDIGLPTHPKVFKLSAAMGWADHDYTVGKLVRFWTWSVVYATDGDLQSRGFNDEQLAGAAGLSSESGGAFVKAMVEACWLDREPYFRIHDWWDNQKHYIKMKYKDCPEKWKHVEGLYAQTHSTNQVNGKSVTDGVTDTVAKTPTNRPTSTNQPTKRASPAMERLEGFQRFWAEYPDGDRKVDRKGCWDVWVRDKLEAETGSILVGLERWKAHWAKKNFEFVKQPISWLRKRFWDTEPSASNKTSRPKNESFNL